MAEPTQINWSLSDDGKTVALEFATDPPVRIVMNLEQVEETLRNLGEFRSRMTPEVAREFEPLRRFDNVVPGPQWYTQAEKLNGDTLLHIRDPRYGWLDYLLPWADAAKLAELLQGLASTRPAPPIKPN